MEFYLVDVKSTIEVNDTDVAFDYINTYYDLDKAIGEAKELSKNDDVLEISVHKWILKEDGTQEHIDDKNCGIMFHFQNRNHRELKGDRII